MKKIILSKTNILKALFTSNISFHKLYKLLNYCKSINKSNISKNNISILILNKALINLLENNTSSESGANTFTIIGKIDYKKLKEQNKIKHPKGINPKTSSKTIILNAKSKKTSKEKIKPQEIKNINQKQKIESHKPVSIRISEQKNLFSKTITITPAINPKKEAIINATIKEKEKNINHLEKPKAQEIENINQLKKSKIKESQKTSVKNASPVKTAIEKPNNIVNYKKQKIETNLPKKENSKQNTTQKPVTKIASKPAPIANKPKVPKYKLQRKSPSVIAALFSAVSASILFGLGLATIGHKKSFSNILFASSLAVLGFGMFANNTKTKDKQLVKKI